MARPKSPPRVCGPYEERGGTRFRIRVIGNGTEKNLYFPRRADALAAKEDAERELLSPATYVISDLIVEFAEDKQSQGSCKPETAAHELGRLQFFLARHLDEDIRDITPKRAEEIYRTATTVISPKTGKPLEAASHRFYLNLAKRFFGWAEKKGYLQANAFKAVRPVGRPNAGKPQLRIDEANRFVATALQMFDEGGDVLALAAVVALLMGMRASEVLKRRVRDVDCGGKVLWIDGGKTRNARRHLKVPKVLQPRLLKLCEGKLPEDPILGPNRNGGPRHHRVLWAAVGRICDRANVPRVCTHSLRGLWATLSIESGALSDVVASSLGHGSFEMTAKHYAQPEAVSGAKTQRVVDLLELDSRPEPMRSADPGEEQAEELLANLPPEIVQKLLQLAVSRGVVRQ